MFAKTPPIPGPRISPPLKAAEIQPITRARCAGVVTSAANAIEVGTNNAADNPPITRDTLNQISELDNAKITSDTAYKNNPATINGFRPIRSESRPTKGDAMNCEKANNDVIIPI